MNRRSVEDEIVFVAVSETMRQEANKVMNKLGINMPIIVSNMQSVAKDLSEFRKASVFISRGGTAQTIESNLLGEVVTIVPSATDYLASLEQCHKMGIDRIGILNYEKGESKIGQQVFRIGGVTLFENTYNEKNVVARIEDLKRNQIQAIVGSRNAVETAKNMGLKGIALTTGDDAIKEAIEQARRLVELKKKQALLEREKNERVVEQFHQLQKHLNNSEQVLSENIKLATDLKSISSETNQKVLDFKDKMQTMDSLIRVIEKISKQINLLGLNAAIEASRSGQFGSG